MVKRTLLFTGVICWLLPFLSIGGAAIPSSAMLIAGAVLLGAAGVVHALERRPT
jgi:hypothetical protein